MSDSGASLRYCTVRACSPAFDESSTCLLRKLAVSQCCLDLRTCSIWHRRSAPHPTPLGSWRRVEQSAALTQISSVARVSMTPGFGCRGCAMQTGMSDADGMWQTTAVLRFAPSGQCVVSGRPNICRDGILAAIHWSASTDASSRRGAHSVVSTSELLPGDRN